MELGEVCDIVPSAAIYHIRTLSHNSAQKHNVFTYAGGGDGVHYNGGGECTVFVVYRPVGSLSIGVRFHRVDNNPNVLDIYLLNCAHNGKCSEYCGF